jgi:DNA-binding response OmpR family regulator/DNA-binding CsgD family transcriptional regulator
MDNTQKYKVLLVDDEPQNIRNLFEVLNPDIYRAFVAINGRSAIDLAIKHLPDAIIMDWEMPEMDGMEAIKIIRVSDKIKDIPIIVATGKMTTVENLRTALETGANDYIRKPYDPIEIEARVNSMIRLRMEQQKIARLEKEIFQHTLDEINREMEINQQELTASKIRLFYNNKNIESLIAELQNLGELVNLDSEKKLTDIISSLKVNTATLNWKEFENHFGKVHPSFFTNLQNRFPSLTNNETEHCAFIKLNMTTSEMIAITHKNENTLKKARQRLKKKFGLNPDDSLYNFIKEIE